MVSTNSNIDFEQVSFNPLKSNTTLLENFSDSDFNFFNENLQSLNTEYFDTEDCSRYLTKINQNSFSIYLHVNIRSINKNFEKCKLMLSEIGFKFKILVLSETWYQDESIADNSLFHLPNNKIVHINRKEKSRGGGVCTFVHDSLNFKERHDISICDSDTESLSMEKINKKEKNAIFSAIYRPPNGKIKPFKHFLKELFSKNARTNKTLYLTVDLNLNVLEYECNTKIKSLNGILMILP